MVKLKWGDLVVNIQPHGFATLKWNCGPPHELHLSHANLNLFVHFLIEELALEDETTIDLEDRFTFDYDCTMYQMPYLHVLRIRNHKDSILKDLVL